jgi:hypothetical protein
MRANGRNYDISKTYKLFVRIASYNATNTLPQLNLYCPDIFGCRYDRGETFNLGPSGYAVELHAVIRE